MLTPESSGGRFAASGKATVFTSFWAASGARDGTARTRRDTVYHYGETDDATSTPDGPAQATIEGVLRVAEHDATPLGRGDQD